MKLTADIHSHHAIAMIELSSIARGLTVLDYIVKKASVELLSAVPVSSGKFLITFAGAEAEVEESWKEACEQAESCLVDQIILYNIHPRLAGGLTGHAEVPPPGEAVAIIESGHLASTVECCDRCLKTADVMLAKIRLGKGIHGKGYFIIHGRLEEVDAARSAADSFLKGRNTFIRSEVIASPHPEMLPHLVVE
jgi:microcompartment protein CcmL/EutN